MTTAMVATAKASGVDLPASWTDQLRKHFIEAVKDEIKSGVFTDSGFKAASWKRIVIHFKNYAHVEYSKSQLQNQYAQMKKKYTEFHNLKENSGFGFDPLTQIPTAPDSVWTSYIAAHPGAAEFRFKTLMYYSDYEEIFSKQIATGEYAMGSATSRAVLSTNNDNIAATIEDRRDDEVGNSSTSAAATISTTSISTASGLNNPHHHRSSNNNRDGSGGVLIPRKRARANDEVVKLLDRLVTHTQVDPVQDAIKLFTSDYAATLVPAHTLRIKRGFSLEPNTATMFLNLSDEERALYIADELSDYA